MTGAGVVLAARISSDLKELRVLADRAAQGLLKAQKENDDFYLDSVALNLHGFYSGLERIFEKIASEIDGSIPSGSNWHRELLKQMAVEIEGIRPAVLSAEPQEKLEEYRGFRHVVRNVYTYHLNAQKIEGLVTRLPAAMVLAETDLTAFVHFLRNTNYVR